MNDASGQNFNLGVTTVTYEATDGQSNTADCAFTVTVNQVISSLFLTASDDTANCNDTDISIAITVGNFTNITALSFSLLWDETVIDYTSITIPGNLQHLDPSDFGTAQVANGILTLAWIDNDGSGETLMNDDTIFILNFSVLGSPGDQSVIEFSDMPTNIIAGQGFPPVSIPVITQDGSASIVDDPPVILGCPSNISISNDPGLCTAIATWTAPTATDDCDGPIVPAQTAGPVPGSAFPVGTTTITYEATDNQNQTTTCSFTVTVNDTENPVPTCPANISLPTDAGVCSAVATYSASVTDNCPGATIAADIASGSTFNLGMTTVTYTAEDAVGNSATCSFTVTVTDNENPVINNCPANVSVNNAPGLCTATATWTAPTATDNCTNPPTLTTSHAPGSSFNVGMTTVTYTAEDAAGNTATCSFTVTVTDNESPTINNCPTNIAQANAAGLCSATVTWTAPSASDNCPGVMLTTTHAPGSSFPVGTTTVTYTATDGAGNSATCSFDVTINDTEAPVPVNCPADITTGTSAVSCDAVVAWVAPNVTDNCPGATITPDIAPGAVFPLGTTTVTYTATDGAGNTATCSFTVTVEDDDAPVFPNGCPADITVNAAAGQCEATATWAAPMATDNCNLASLAAVPASGSTFPVGTTTGKYTATDDAGNSATCTFTVTVVDNQPPVLTGCPISINQNNAPGECGSNVTWTSPSVSDNCPDAGLTSTHVPGDFFPVGTTTVTYTATDANGNTATCAFDVTVVDMEPPVINNCPADFTQNNDPGACDATVTWTEPTAADNCPGVMLTSNLSPGANLAVGSTTTVTYTATDGVGATAACSFEITVVDNEAPIIAGCPANISQGNDTGTCDAVATWTAPTVSDNCPNPTLTGSHAPGSTFPVGTTTVTYTAEDAAGNTATCSFTVTVSDLEAPVITGCPGNITAPADPGICDATVTWTAPAATDNCGVTSFTSSQSPGDLFPTGSTTVTYTAEDAAGNETTCSFIVMVEENEPPVINGCPTNISQGNDTGDCEAVVTWTTPTVSDNCPNPTLTGSHAPGSTFPVGTTTVTYTAEDAAGNTATCSFTVTVSDLEAPVITGCPGNITAPADPGSCDATVTWTAPAATDNCGVTTFTSSHSPGDLFPAGATTVTYTAEDAAGNETTCSFIVTVEENEPPVIMGCPSDISQGNDTGDCEAVVTWTAPTVSDNCPNPTLTGSHAPGDVFPVGTTTVTYTAEDAAGNTAVCSFEITVTDNQAPIIAGCPADISMDTDLDECDAAVTWTVPSPFDNCPGLTFSGSHAPGSTFPVGTTTVTYTAEDVAGNTTTCSFEITVADNEPPVIAGCPSDISQDNDTDECGAAVNWTEPTATDNCPNLTFTTSHSSGDVFPEGTTTVTYTATDDAGNTATCSFEVTVNDTQNPTLTGCPGDITQTTDPGDCGAAVNWDAPTATDNCSFTLTSSHDPGDTFPVGTTTVNYTVEDIAGNTVSCSFEVEVTDGEAPELECLADLTVEIPVGTAPVVVNGIPLFSLFDNCGVDSSYWQLTGATTGSGSGFNASGATFNIGVTTVTYFAVDEAGNEGFCSFTVTVEEEGILEITCPGNQSSANLPGTCGAVFSGLAAIVTPASGLANLSYVLSGATIGNGSGQIPDGTVFNFGTTMVTYTTFGGSGSVTCSFAVVVADTEAPVISSCPADIVTVNGPGQCGANVTWQAPTASDNCGVIAFTVSQASGTFFPAETTPVQYVAVDATGNVAQCQFNIVVQDTEHPVFTNCPGNLTVNTDPGNCTAFVTWPVPIASDNCSAILTTTHQPGSTFAVGTTQVQYKATDPSGNMDTCAFNITVIDNQPPVILNIPSNLVVFTQPDDCGAIVSWTVPTAVDNCGIQTFSCNVSPGTFFSVTDPGNPVEVECVALDIHGNVTIETFDIIVIDNTPPAINCPDNLTISLDGSAVNDPSGFLTGIQPMDCEKTILSFADPVATDACGIAALLQTQGPPSGSPFGVSVTTLSFLAVDNNGNESTCTIEIAVTPAATAVASAFPQVPCEGDEVFFFVNEYVGATYIWTDPNGDIIGSGEDNFLTLPAISLSQTGIFTVEIVLPFCTLETTVTVDVALLPDIEITANDLLCTDGSMPLNLVANDLANTSVSQWIWEFPGGALAFGQNQTVNNATPANAGTYSVVAINENGCIGFSEIEVEIFSEPMLPTLFGTASAVCKGEPVVINGQPFAGNNVTYNWSATPAQGSGLTPINNSVVNVVPTLSGQYIYEYFVEVDGCASATATWSVNVEEAPVLDLSADGQTACVDGTTSVILRENGNQATNWQWVGPLGAISGNVDSIVLQNVNAASSGLYTVTATTDLGCQSTASITLNITMQPSPAAQLVASSDEICAGGAVTLSGTPYGAGATYVWTGPNLPPFPQNLSTVNVVLNQAGTFDYTFAAIVNGCSTDTVGASILVENAPAVNITASGPVNCVDGTTPIVLSSNSPDAATWQWTDSNGNVLINTETLTLQNVTAANSGVYTVTASSSIGCSTTSNFVLNISDGLPPISASLKGKACEESALEFDATFISGATYTWRNPAGNVFADIQDPVIQGATTARNGIYTVTASVNGCTSTATVEVNVLTAPVANNEEVVGNVNTPQSFNVVVNDQLVDGEPYTITVLQQPENGTVSVGNQGVLTFRPNRGFREKDKMFYEICYNACPDLCDIASVDIRVVFPQDTCVITTVITPNNDGINDNFVVSCLELDESPLNKLIVFNQWGDKVYEAAPYKNDWKGTYEGRDLPDATYFFIFQRDPDVQAQKGFVMIHR